MQSFCTGYVDLFGRLGMSTVHPEDVRNFAPFLVIIMEHAETVRGLMGLDGSCLYPPYDGYYLNWDAIAGSSKPDVSFDNFVDLPIARRCGKLLK